MDVKSMIEQSGLKKSYIAEKLGLTNGYFSMMINGTRAMPDEIEREVKRLCARQLTA